MSGTADSAAGSGRQELERVGRYRILRELGCGGMGVVYLAEDTRLLRKVALKVLSSALAASPQVLLRFRREAEIASRLDHPGICTVYEAGEEAGVAYIAMRYVEGDTLAQRLAARKDGAVPESAEIGVISGWIERSARALHAAHEAGLIHRDVKPGNVMITPQGDPVILDFGLARPEDEGQLATLTQTGAVLGTPAYMSPEQILAAKFRLDRRTDVYSLGVTLYELLTLKLPHEAATFGQLYQEILSTQPESPRRLNPHVTDELRVVVETAIEKERDRRYATALEFAEDLRRIRENEPIRARPAGPALRLRRWAQRNPVVATAVVAAFLLLASGLAIALELLGRVRSERDGKDAALLDVQRQRDARSRELVRAGGLALAAESRGLVPIDPGLALALAVEASRRAPGLESNTALIEAMEVSRELRRFDHPDIATGVAFSADGRSVFTTSDDGVLRKWDVGDGTETASVRSPYSIALSLAPGGATLAVLEHVDETLTADLVIRDAATLGERSRLRVAFGDWAGGRIRYAADGLSIWVLARDTAAKKDSSFPIHVDLATGRADADDAFDGLSAELDPSGAELVGWAHRRIAHRDRAGKLHEWRLPDPPAGVAEDECEQVACAFFSGRAHATGLLVCPLEPMVQDRPRRWCLRLVDADAGGVEVAAAEVTSADHFEDALVARNGARGIVSFGCGSVVEVTLPPGGLGAVPAEWGGMCTMGLWASPEASVLAAGIETASSGGGLGYRLDVACRTAGAPDVVRLRSHWEGITGVDFDPARRRMATACQDGSARVWDLAAAREVLTTDAKGVEAVAWSPDGRTVATAIGPDCSLVDSVTGAAETLPWGPEATRSQLRVVLFSPDGRRLLAGATLYDATTRRTVVTLRSPIDRRGNAERAAFGPDGGRVAIGWSGGGVDVFDVASGSSVARTDPDIHAESVEFTPDGDAILLVGWHRTALVDAASCKDLVVFDDAADPTRAGRVVPSLHAALLGFESGRVALFRLADGVPTGFEVTHPLHEGDKNGVKALDVSPDAAVLATASQTGTIVLWDARSGARRHVLQGPLRTGLVRFSRDGALLLAASDDGACDLFDVATGEPVIRVADALGSRIILGAGNLDADALAAFDPAGRRFTCIATGDGAVRLLPTDPAAAARRMDVRALLPAERERYVAPLEEDYPVHASARALVDDLLSTHVLVAEVVAHLQTGGGIDESVRKEALRLARGMKDDEGRLFAAGLRIVGRPGRPRDQYLPALPIARRAAELAPDDSSNAVLVGVALYRTGEIQEAVLALTKAEAMSGTGGVVGPAFLAMARFRLGDADGAKRDLQTAKSRVTQQSSDWAKRSLAEAEQTVR